MEKSAVLAALDLGGSLQHEENYKEGWHGYLRRETRSHLVGVGN